LLEFIDELRAVELILLDAERKRFASASEAWLSGARLR
jgi:hypothetical protein